MSKGTRLVSDICLKRLIVGFSLKQLLHTCFILFRVLSFDVTFTMKPQSIEKVWYNCIAHHSAHLLVKIFFACYVTARKTIFSLSKCTEKMAFPKKSHWNMIFMYHQERWYFVSPKTWSYSLDRKWKMIFNKKKYMEIWYSLQIFWKDSLSKKITLEYSCIIRKDSISFSQKIYFF